MKKRLIAPALIAFAAAALAAGPAQDVFEALGRRDVQAVKAIIEKDPRLVDARDASLRTPLHYAALGADADLIGWLVSKGAKLELQDDHLKTPLHLAAMGDRTAAVAALVKAGPASRRATTISERPSFSAPASAGRRRPGGCSSKPARTSMPSTSSATAPSGSRPGGARPISSISSSKKGPRSPRAGRCGRPCSRKPPRTA
ncbi:MAG: Ankyrin repeat (3 copies) [Candidatus Aminicenantes bacterium]|nr:Ankyrin repeat (3 copies) [Candidatus Aminicenantes bacterium]